MSVIFILIGASVAVALIFLLGFTWAYKDGQYDDDVSPAVRILFDDDTKRSNSCQKKSTKA